MEFIRTIFIECEKLGIQDEWVVLSLVGAILAWFV